jgi:methylated-DNA-protein-cysteine methyltransferase related protein
VESPGLRRKGDVRRRAVSFDEFLGRPRRRRPAARTGAAADPALAAIWQAVCTIPRGRVSTYGAVAQAAGLPGRARQVGRALRIAPAGLNLPWHRVVGAGGRIALASGSDAHREQTRRLRAEGVAVRNGRVARAALTGSAELRPA